MREMAKAKKALEDQTMTSKKNPSPAIQNEFIRKIISNDLNTSGLINTINNAQNEQ